MMRAIDLAYANDSVAGFCQSNGVPVVCGYVYNPHISNGSPWHPAGWSADYLQGLINAGLRYVPIVTMRPSTGEIPSASAVVAAIRSMPRNTDLVGVDVETGSDPGRDEILKFTGGVRAEGFRTIVYGHGDTLAAGYADGSYKWGAAYLDDGWNDARDPASKGWDAWQYAGDVSPGGFGVDLSTWSIPLMARKLWWFGG